MLPSPGRGPPAARPPTAGLTPPYAQAPLPSPPLPLLSPPPARPQDAGDRAKAASAGAVAVERAVLQIKDGKFVDDRWIGGRWNLGDASFKNAAGEMDWDKARARAGPGGGVGEGDCDQGGGPLRAAAAPLRRSLEPPRPRPARHPQPQRLTAARRPTCAPSPPPSHPTAAAR